MAMREDLVELIRDGRFKAENICNDNMDCQSCTIYDPYGYCKYGCIADHLIAHGVTIQKWIPVTERLPEGSQTVLAISPEYEEYQIGWLANSAEGGTVCIGDGIELYGVTHWMPLPEAPKGE